MAISEHDMMTIIKTKKRNPNKFTQEGWRLCDVVTGGESWFYLKKAGKKSSNASWLAEIK